MMSKMDSVFYVIWICAMDWMFVYPQPKFIFEKPNHQYDYIRKQALWRWLDHKGRTHMDGMSALIKGTLQSYFPSSVIWGHSERHHLQTRRLVLTRDWVCRKSWISQPPVVWEKKFCLYAIQCMVLLCSSSKTICSPFSKMHST
jgi:hypothetical protein